ncbi:cytochrome P450 [Marasmius fiardii PR-910]|nr:cytochrome P450 [Marasmius fiardii PR-910]
MELLKLFATFSISFVVLRLFLERSNRRGLPLPPGPKRLPILGNILEVRAKRKEPRCVLYSNWSRIYGDVFTLDVLGSRTIVLNSYKAITELLEHRSHNNSDRPRQPMLMELAKYQSWNLGFMRYSDSWRLHRRTFHQFFQPRMMTEYYDIQRKRTTTLVQKLLKSPEDFFKHVRAHAGGIILEIVYGYHIQDNNDPYVKVADDGAAGLRETGIVGTFFVDYVPALKHIPAWFPGASFKAKAEMWARDGLQLRDLPWAHLKQSMVNETAEPSFSTKNMEKFKIPLDSSDESGMEEVIKNCAGVAYLAGADTTVSAILSFILGMVLNPEIQARAQKELDEVVGSFRLPDFADRESLPYINAILSETLRWKPVTPLAVAHATVNDDIYEGHFIPGGSTLVPNAWAVLHDEALYGPDVMSFNPDRFMKQGKDLPPNPELAGAF